MKLTPRVHLVGSGKVGGLRLTDDFDCHVYLVDGGTEMALVDAGFGRHPRLILDEVTRSGLDPARITSVLLTHAHADHAGGAAFFRRELGARVAIHASVADAVEAGDAVAIDLKPAADAGLFPGEYQFEPCPIDVRLHDGMRLRVGDIEIQAIDTPGHAAGHVSFDMTVERRRHLFAGDAVFAGGRILLLSFPSCSLQAYLSSLRRLANLDVEVLLPGHSLFALRDGQEHIDQALAVMARCAVPPDVVL